MARGSGKLALATVALAVAGSAHAAPIAPGDRVPGHPAVTYLDLVRQAVPSLAPNRKDGQVEGRPGRRFRHIAGSDYEGDPPDPLVLGYIQDRRIQVGGKPRLLVFADLGPDPDRAQGTGLLLLFDDAPKPRLLDAADVSIDKDTEISDAAGKLSLGPGDDAIVTYGEHNDADLTMGGYVLISPIGDRLRMVGIAHVVSARLCGWTSTQSARFASTPDPPRPHARVDAVVRMKIARTDEDCGDQPRPKASVRAFNARYRWNTASGRYETEFSQFKALDALNEKGF
jgi:hypothetical protein